LRALNVAHLVATSPQAKDKIERRFQIAPTSKKYVTILFHPNTKLWVLEDALSSIWPTILGHFSL
jgi:hypothetical protein